MSLRVALFFVRAGLLVALLALAGDVLGWNLCGEATCGSGLWLQYRYLFGLVPVSGLAVLMTFTIQALWQLHLANADEHPAYASMGWWLLWISVGGALFHVYVQVAFIGEFCALCLGLTATLIGAVALAPAPGRPSMRAGAVAMVVGFLAFNFAHHPGPLRWLDRGGTMLDTALGAETAPAPTKLKLDVPAAGLQAAKVIGDGQARVSLEVFSDLACPHCARFEAEVLPFLIERFVQLGRLRIVQRSFYAPGHDEAAVADVLAHAAVFVNGPAALVTARREFFRQQDAWPGQPVLALASLVDPQALLRAVQTHRGEIKAVLEADLNRARELGITAPPSFAITAGEHRDIIVGMRPSEVFNTAIERALGQVTP